MQNQCIILKLNKQNIIMDHIYKLVDEIYCINLIEREDRYLHMKKFEIDENIKLTFHRTKRSQKGGMYGCFHSHIKVIKQAYDKNQKYIMIFEDDTIRTLSYDKVNYDEIIKFFKTDKWDVIKFASALHFVPQYWVPKIYNNLYKGPTELNNAYILNRKSMSIVLNTYDQYIGKCQIDRYFCHVFKRIYNVMPVVFDQDWLSDSNNEFPLGHTFGVYVRKYIYYKCNLMHNLSLLRYYINKIYILVIIISLTITYYTDLITGLFCFAMSWLIIALLVVVPPFVVLFIGYVYETINNDKNCKMINKLT